MVATCANLWRSIQSRRAFPKRQHTLSARTQSTDPRPRWPSFGGLKEEQGDHAPLRHESICVHYLAHLLRPLASPPRSPPSSHFSGNILVHFGEEGDIKEIFLLALSANAASKTFPCGSREAEWVAKILETASERSTFEGPRNVICNVRQISIASCLIMGTSIMPFRSTCAYQKGWDSLWRHSRVRSLR
jgi:hypothetical protein